MYKLLLLAAVFPAVLFAQNKKQKKALEAQRKADEVIVSEIKSHVESISATAGYAEKQREYIANQFKTIGLQPPGNSGYYQHFKINDGKEIDSATLLKINNSILEVGKDFIPLSFSAEKSVTGMPAMALRERGVPWFVDVKDLVDENEKKTGFNLSEVISKEAARVNAKGGTALFLYNSSSSNYLLGFDKYSKIPPSNIPVVYILPPGFKKHFADQSELLDIELKVAFREKLLNEANLVGYVDNKAPQTIVISSPYIISGSSETGLKDTAIQRNYSNNIYGTTTLLELAKMLAKSKAKNNNYLFIAAGGDPKGISGLKSWITNPLIASPVNFLVNVTSNNDTALDQNNLTVSGDITAVSDVMTAISNKNSQLKIAEPNNTNDIYSSVLGKELPHICFTNTVSRAKIGDTGISNINFENELKITKFINNFIEALNLKGNFISAK